MATSNSIVVFGKGRLGSRIAKRLKTNCIVGSELDLRTQEVQLKVFDYLRRNTKVLIALRPRPPESFLQFYTSTSLLAPILGVLGCEVTLLSSSSVYGSNLRAREHDTLLPTTDYGKAKFVEESVYRAWIPEQKLKVLRLFDLYGPDTTGVVSRIIKARDESFGCTLKGSIVVDLMHIDDVAEAVAILFNRVGPLTCNIGTGVGRTVSELSSMVGAPEPRGVEYKNTIVACPDKFIVNVGSSFWEKATNRFPEYIKMIREV